ncbi:MAG: hypothetical protein NTY77_16715 [Elusimicrobia bacterium]|nr:hypothetical protein [Elusimicrobiota bacterium]
MTPRPRVCAVLCLALLAAWPVVSARSAAAPSETGASPLTEDERKSFSLLGLSVDKLAAPDLARYRAPFDFHKESLNDEEKDGLLYAGNRFDEDTGHILSLQSKQPLTVLDIEVSRRNTLLGQKDAILAKLSLLLSQQEPGKPLSPQAQTQVKALVDAYPGALPPSLVKTLTTPGLSASSLHADAAQAYEASTRFFDGQNTLKDWVGNALPVKAEPTSAYAAKVYFDDTEKRLGQTLRASVADELMKNPVGRELLDHFRDRKGELDLPHFLILRIDPKAMAVYSSSNKSVVFNQRIIEDALMDGVPAKDQPKLRRELADSKKFAAYLLAHPEAFQKAVAANGTTFLHELTHAWQDRREGLMGEGDRGNVPGVNAIENEHEAFLMEVRWLHARLLADPKSAAKDEMLDSYRQFLANPDLWRNDITQRYLANWPQSSADFPTALQLQEQRVGVARKFMGEGLHQRLVQAIKLLGYQRGTEEMKKSESAARKRVAEFDKTVYPQMRQEGMRGLAELFLSLAREAEDADDRKEALKQAEGYAQELNDKELQRRVEELRPKPGRKGR